MRSQEYQPRSPDLLRPVFQPLLVLAGFAAALHLGARLGLLPAPRPTLDVDRTVLIHQAEASRRPQEAGLVLLGDSSCLMDVAAPLLGERLGQPVLNLGTLSRLSPESQTLLLRNYVRANPGRLRAVVLLMHPEGLRLDPGDAWQNRALRCFLDGADFQPRATAADVVGAALGVPILQGRVLARLLPRPLPGAWGQRYGFTADLERHLTRHRGSAVDPEAKPATGRPEYWLAPGLQPASAAFRAALPPGVKLYAGLTPLPETFAGPTYPAQRDALLRAWSGWVQADAALVALPAVLPDACFAQKTHLNETGQRAYTLKLAETLASRLP